MKKLKISTLLEYDRAGLKVCHHNWGKATFPPWEQEHKTGLIYSQSQIREETDTNTNTYILGRQNLCEGTKGLRWKVWTQTKILSPNIRYFVAILRFVAIYALFGDLWAKKVPFGVKNSVSWARSALLHGIYCIFNWVNFANLFLTQKKTHFCPKISKKCANRNKSWYRDKVAYVRA